MKRRMVWIALALAAMLVLGSAWFLANFDQVVVDSWEQPGQEARRNRFLALEKFLGALGRTSERIADPGLLDRLPPGVLILDSGRRGLMTPQRVRNLLAWVERGGYVITTPEAGDRSDPLLGAFDIDCTCKDSPPPPEPGAPAAVPKKPPPRVSVSVPGSGRPLKIRYQYSNLAPGKVVPAWAAGAEGFPAQVLHYSHGRGQITVVSDLNGLFNDVTIGREDHADVLLALLETYQPDPRQPVFLLTRLAGPSLWAWLAEVAAPALVGGLVLLLVWLWQRLPRFGPVVPGLPPERRELGEHLAAVGRYVWRCGGLETWLSVAREAFQQRLTRRHPQLAVLPPGEQVAALAALSGRSHAAIAAALHQAAATPHSFTQALYTLQRLERSL
ncbi:MAG: DUF4350 domain-containing protein [Betaproteobacteria bacterium]|nr:DUF4350 domain-containing protein [Betaproteobacteria bacterium]